MTTDFRTFIDTLTMDGDPQKLDMVRDTLEALGGHPEELTYVIVAKMNAVKGLCDRLEMAHGQKQAS
jgi:hypothetical protein